MTLTRIFITSITLLCLFSSCKKDDVPGLSDKLLLRVVNNVGDSILYTSLHYDTQNRLISITDSTNRNEAWETYIEYNSEGSPIKFKTIEDDRNGYRENSDTLIYENGKVFKKISTSTTGSYTSIHSYNYDANNRIISDYLSSPYSQGTNTYNFIYDNNNDVIKIDGIATTQDTTIRFQVLTALHNSHENPYGNLGLLYYFLTDRNDLLSKHNRTQAIYDYEVYNYAPVTENYTYEYDNGLPTKMIMKRGEGVWRFDVTTIDFYYN